MVKNNLEMFHVFVHISAAINTSSMYVKVKDKPLNISSINLWKDSAEFLKSDGILVNSNKPKVVVLADSVYRFSFIALVLSL